MATTLATDRAILRRLRLLELANEQQLEEAEAFELTEEQRVQLFNSFRSVKFEWSDLDGMGCSSRDNFAALPNAAFDDGTARPSSFPATFLPAHAAFSQSESQPFHMPCPSSIHVSPAPADPTKHKPRTKRSKAVFASPLRLPPPK
ncbi:hypothetical protein B0H13DRAFT_38593 [Mycena leptocephala]|nr:hypothetical protein B0H13DRAFT_38593 [Mycena leptocephala]